MTAAGAVVDFDIVTWVVDAVGPDRPTFLELVRHVRDEAVERMPSSTTADSVPGFDVRPRLGIPQARARGWE